MHHASQDLKADRELAMIAVKREEAAFSLIAQELKDDRHFVLQGRAILMRRRGYQPEEMPLSQLAAAPSAGAVRRLEHTEAAFGKMAITPSSHTLYESGT